MTKRIIIFLTSLVFFTGAFLNAQNSKTLIVYFSWGGNTRVAAENTKRLTGADIFEITVKNPYPTDYDLILCRNVVIYFTDEAKDMIYSNFYKSLKSKGVLFIGSTEQITNYRELGFDRMSSFYFEKP